MHKDPGHAPARRRHANDAVRCTASYLARRGAHPGSVTPPRSRLKTILPCTTTDTHFSLRPSDLTATYLSTAGPAGRRRRGCGSSNDHARPARGEPGLYRGDAAFKLRGALSPAPLLAGVGRLSRLPAMASHSASQLASGRRRRSPRLAATKAGRWFIHRPGVDGISFTVHPGWL